jgi:conjugal transfer pilus assembly protein TraU
MVNVVKCIFVILLSFVSIICAADEKIGNTYPIVESDMFEDVEKAVASTDWKGVLKKNEDDWSAFGGVKLPLATAHRNRRVIPWYTTDIEIKDPRNGEILYPKGFTFNPLQYRSLPFRVLILAPGQEDWLKDNLRATDVIAYTFGNVPKMTLEHNLSSNQVFILNSPMVKEMRLEFVPSIVTQYKNAYQIEEFEIEQWRGDKNNEDS